MEKVKKGDMLYIVRNVGRDEMKIVTSAGPKWFSVEGIIEKFSQDRMTTGWARAYRSQEEYEAPVRRNKLAYEIKNVSLAKLMAIGEDKLNQILQIINS